MNNTLKIGFGVGVAVALILLLLPAGQFSGRPAPPTEIERVSPETLSDWLLQDREALLVVDLRPTAESTETVIPSSVAIPLEAFDEAAVRSMPPHRRVVLVDGDTSRARQAWQRLAANHDRVYVLDGGIDAWASRILNPAPPPPEADESEWRRYRERTAVAHFFNGTYDSVKVEPKRTVSPVLRPRPTVAGGEGC